MIYFEVQVKHTIKIDAMTLRQTIYFGTHLFLGASRAPDLQNLGDRADFFGATGSRSPVNFEPWSTKEVTDIHTHLLLFASSDD
jgi:hypothetical protein